MNQQINLYQTKNSESKATIYLSAIVFVFMAITFSVYSNNKVDTLRIDVAQQQLLLANAETHSAKMRIKYPKQPINSLLEKRIKQSQSLHQNLLDVITLISDSTSDKTQGFSRYFTAFAQQKTSGIWIKQVTINAKQSSINLQGGTSSAESVPIFLQNLHNEPIFNGKVFARLNIDTDLETDELSFNINTLLIDDDDDLSMQSTDTTSKRTEAIAEKIKGSL